MWVAQCQAQETNQPNNPTQQQPLSSGTYGTGVHQGSCQRAVYSSCLHADDAEQHSMTEANSMHAQQLTAAALGGVEKQPLDPEAVAQKRARSITCSSRYTKAKLHK